MATGLPEKKNTSVQLIAKGGKKPGTVITVTSHNFRFKALLLPRKPTFFSHRIHVYPLLTLRIYSSKYEAANRRRDQNDVREVIEIVSERFLRRVSL